MIVNVRGWMGSGKTTLVQKFIDRHDAEIIESIPSRNDLTSSGRGFHVYKAPASNLFVFGRYRDPERPEAGCSGGDMIEGDGVWAMMEAMSPGNFILVESLKLSRRGGNSVWTDILLRTGSIIAFVDTPFEISLARVEERRARSGRRTSLGDPEKARSEYEGIVKYSKAAVDRGVPGFRLDYRDDVGYQQLHNILSRRGWDCGKEHR